jgi:hypothetical protein
MGQGVGVRAGAPHIHLTLGGVIAVVCTVGLTFALSGCASSGPNADDEPEQRKVRQPRQVETGMTDNEVRSLLGESVRVRTIDNAHPIRRDQSKPIQAVLEGSLFEVWEYPSVEGSHYGVLFNTATGRVEGTYAPGTHPAGTTP